MPLCRNRDEPPPSGLWLVARPGGYTVCNAMVRVGLALCPVLGVACQECRGRSWDVLSGWMSGGGAPEVIPYLRRGAEQREAQKRHFFFASPCLGGHVGSSICCSGFSNCSTGPQICWTRRKRQGGRRGGTCSVQEVVGCKQAASRSRTELMRTGLGGPRPYLLST